MKFCLCLLFLLCQYHSYSQNTRPQKIRFDPVAYSREFTSKLSPAMRIQEGDTIITNSVDAVGIDKNGVKVTERGNPLTGPFYLESAKQGDVLAITITEVRLNRDFATTLNTLVPKVTAKKEGMKAWRSAKLVKWQLDLERMVGRPDSKYEKLKDVRLPLHPFIGCVGIAPAGNETASSGASGTYGGNLDFRYITKGATVYLPVFHDGAYLFMGDGHAAQGDGELNGDALETSMDFEFTLRILKDSASRMPTPMVEDPVYFMVFGIETSLEKSMKVATEALSAWLQSKYELNAEEVSQLIGLGIEYRIAKVAATKVEVVAMLPKKLLTSLIGRK